MLGVEKMDERLLAAVLASPFVITMVGFAVAIAFAPGHQSGTRHYIRMKHPRQEIFGQPRAPDHQWHRA
jgi:hypothetical protein